MFQKNKIQTEEELKNYRRNLIDKLENICKASDVYSAEKGDMGYLDEEDELEAAINRLIKVKTAQTRALFVKNAEIIEFVTQMDYIKEMVENLITQKDSVADISTSSEQMSHAIEEVAVYVQNSLTTTTETISMSSKSLKTINQTFDYINKSFDEIVSVQDKMQNVVDDTKEIENIVNIINEVAEETNLLALNASIEAARAGEKGRGFAVVAGEIKKLAENTKESANYIRTMVKKLRDKIGASENVIEDAVKTFSEGKVHINEATGSMDQMESSLQKIGDAFDGISANIEEQSATTQEMSARLAEINSQTNTLYEIGMKTGQDIFNFSTLTEDCRNMGRPWFKDFQGMDMVKPMIGEHLLWKWKVYNVICGFTKTDENSINEFTECTLGKMLDNLLQTHSSSPLVKLYEPHKNVHMLCKKIIRDVNNGNKNNIDTDIQELNSNMAVLIDGLREICM